MHLTVTLKEDI